MKFISCPSCGMKNIDTLKYCKSCNFCLDGGIEARPGIKSKDNEKQAIKPAAEKISKPSIHNKDTAQESNAGKISENKENDFSDLIHSGAETIIEDTESENIEVVSKSEEPVSVDTGANKNTYYKSTGAAQVINVNIIEEKQPKHFFSDNFQRNVLPRLLQIAFIFSFLLFVSACAYVYSIMDLPQYYDTFHMRVESAKNFFDTITQLNVCENAKKSASLKLQYDEIRFNYLNKYFKWNLYVLNSEESPDGSKIILTVKKQLKDTEKHTIILYLSKNFQMKRKKLNLKITENKAHQITGRIIDWKRDNVTRNFEIQLYNCEVLD
ncbi:MAG: hypothetical protein QMC67_08865 [Candidatus Wallbacteria bacterium]